MPTLPTQYSTTFKPYWSSPRSEAQFYLGDCVQVMNRLPARSVDLLFADPPFNIGMKYDNYFDRKPKQDYLDWTLTWMQAARRLLKPSASIYVSIGIALQAEVKLLMDKVFAQWRDTIVWHFSFGARQTTKFTPSWVAIHYYVQGLEKAGWTWNQDAVSVPSARQLKYNDKRAVSSGKLPDNVWVLLPGEDGSCFRAGDNCWLESRVCGTFKERTLHPCQMPIPVLERIVLASSNPGDMVMDPFLGSCTSGIASIRHNRKFIGIELSESYVRDICIPRTKSEIGV